MRGKENDTDPFPVARLAVVPVINNKNPYLSLILKKGIRRDDLMNLFSGNASATWGDLFGKPGKDPVRVYIRADRAWATEVWLRFLFLDSAEMKGIPVTGEADLVEKVKQDPLALSYCNFIAAIDPQRHQIAEGLAVAPMDINQNGKLDEKENFYQGYTELQRAMWSGKYPHVLIRDLYFVIKGKPHTLETVSFLKWVLTEGKKLIPSEGYIELHTSEIRCRLNFLSTIDSPGTGQ